MNALTLSTALAVAQGTLEEARKLELPPITVAVLDARGVLRACLVEDGSSLMRPDIAAAKAWGALGMGRPTRDLAGLAEFNPPLVSAFVAISQGRMLPAAGGVLFGVDGTLLGAVGVSGAMPDQDEACAIAGLAAAGVQQHD
ncbi:MAG: heme-binding protein [bacterium]|nr:heme-binding protein [bacterium]